MKNGYEYYKKIIIPIEKKYNNMCTLYQIFKLKIFKEKRDLYNHILINCYQVLINNQNALNELIEYFKFI